MTMGLGGVIPQPTVAPDATVEERRVAEVRHAATQFEGLLIQQLVQVMRSTVQGGMFGDGPGSEMYAHLFDSSLADSMAAGGGLGMRQVMERSMLGPQAYAAAQQMQGAPMRPFVPRTVGAPLEVRPVSGAPVSGATGLLQRAARGMLGPSGFAPQWGREGRLSREDLASDFQTEGPRGVAAFNVEDASGFEGAYKCNLFAFELARRAGFEVPLIGRPRGWGYMGPDGVTADAAAGSLRGGWGRVATGETAESLDTGIVRDGRAFMLTADGLGDRSGHMGVVERVHEVHYDEQGQIDRIVFDGWEGQTRGARHLTRRVWARPGHGGRVDGGDGVRGGLSRIEIVELRRAAPGTAPERPLHPHARPSVHDVGQGSNLPSRPPAVRPMETSEEESR